MRRWLMLGTVLAVVSACGESTTGPSNTPPPPPNPDLDGDGIPNSVDVCPNQAETVNNWSDTDGCPDTSTELYMLVREDVEDYWNVVFANSDLAYSPITTFQSYSSPITTPCETSVLNNAFYCPINQGVYYHKEFVDGFLLEIGDAAAAYVIAHEIGHHISLLLWYLHELIRPPCWYDDSAPCSSRKEGELQADCFAGAWLAYVQQPGGSLDLEEGDVEEAVNALMSVADPESIPWFNPDGHGTRFQRISAAGIGFDVGLGACITDDFYRMFPEVGRE